MKAGRFYTDAATRAAIIAESERLLAERRAERAEQRRQTEQIERDRQWRNFLRREHLAREFTRFSASGFGSL